MTTSNRTYTTRRQSIVNALVTQIKTINGTGSFLTNLSNNVSPRLKFWDEVDDFPAVHINAGNETREYQGGGYKDRFLAVTLRCYVNSDDSVNDLDKLLEDIETVISLLEKEQYTSVGFKSLSFYGGFDRYLTGFEERAEFI